MSIRAWVADTAPSTRFPVYTRLNAQEVLPDPLTPLGASLCWAPELIPGWGLAYVEDEAFHPDEVDHESAVAALIYGYLYANLSALRVLGIRRGLTWDQVDAMFFGVTDAPPHAASEQDVDPALARGIPERLGWAMTVLEYPQVDEDWAMALRVRTERPDLSQLSPRMLVARARAVMPYARVAFRSLMNAATNGGVLQGTMAAMLGDAGAHLVIPLLSAPTDLESASPARRMWALSRLPAGSGEFEAGFRDFIADYGYRGPGELDPGVASWETDPSLPLAMIEHLRSVAAEGGASEGSGTWEEALDAARALLDDESRGQFEAVFAAARRFATWREMGRAAVGILINEARVSLAELGRRLAQDGVLERPGDIAMALDSELDGLALGSREFAQRLSQRATTWGTLADLAVPTYIDTRSPIPALDSLPRRAATAPPAAAAGETLRGAPASAGTVEGAVHVARTPGDAVGMTPGSILVAPRTDTSWTPLFLSAGAVVVETGSAFSHAMIVSRELGIPCVAAVANATRLLRKGDIVRVDGGTGTVEVVSQV